MLAPDQGQGNEQTMVAVSLAAQWLVTLAVVLALLLAHAEPARQAGGDADWAPTSLSEPVWRLFTPTSGALFALTAQVAVSDHVEYLQTVGLRRSDDAGTTWRPVAPP